MTTKTTPKRASKRSIVALVILGVIAILFALCAIYVSDYYSAGAEAVAAMASDAHITVEGGDDLVFIPEEPQVGLIFYPGGKVEHTAYAPLMRKLAEQGILCVVVEMPFHLAVLDVNGAEGIQAQYPQISRWYIGGHSLGGSMAASYAADHGAELEGVILLAAYSTADLSAADLEVLSLYGSEDGVLNREKYDQYWGNLPGDTIQYIIDGGNHAGFGDYGAQEGDGTATLSAEEQWAITVEQCVDFMLP